MKRSVVLIALAALLLSSLACAVTDDLGLNTPSSQDNPFAPVLSEGQLYKITGSMNPTNDITTVYYDEHSVALIDMHGFVTRDLEWEIPVQSQVLGYMDYDEENLQATYSLFVPLLPQGQFNDVDNDGAADTGVQIFAVDYLPNLYGGPFAAGDDRYKGWPGYLASVVADTENEYEIIGGKLVIWAPDGQQSFPSDFGADGLLFTADDPAAPVGMGYSIVDLDTRPFTVTQTTTAVIDLIEPEDASIKDFSEMNYLEAWDALFNFVSTNYAFNGVSGKQPDWQALNTTLRPKVEQGDAQAFYEAVRALYFSFRDGHVNLSGDPLIADFRANYLGGYGFSIRTLDSGEVIVKKVMPGSPADRAGMQVGATVTAFNGQDINTAINNTQPLFLESSPTSLRVVREVWLLRAPVGNTASVTFNNPGGGAQTVTLTAEGETDLLFEELGWNESDTILPVDSELIVRDGVEIGYIRINSNYDDLNFLIDLFERALKYFEERQVRGLIVDMRFNGGGAPLGLAGFLTDQTIPTGQDEYYSDLTGKFEAEGQPGEIIPNENVYTFDNIVLLVGRNCYSACEFESYGFSQVPGAKVVGMYATAGVFAEVSRGQIKLPNGLEMQVPTGRTILPDGSFFLEDVGVQPDYYVPITRENVLSTQDVVLEFGIRVVLGLE